MCFFAFFLDVIYHKDEWSSWEGLLYVNCVEVILTQLASSWSANQQQQSFWELLSPSWSDYIQDMLIMILKYF